MYVYACVRACVCVCVCIFESMVYFGCLYWCNRAKILSPLKCAHGFVQLRFVVVIVTYKYSCDLFTHLNFNSSMDKLFPQPDRLGWNFLSIPKLQRLHRWSLRMDNQFHPTLCNVCDYLCMMDVQSLGKKNTTKRKPCASFCKYTVRQESGIKMSVADICSVCILDESLLIKAHNLSVY